MGTAPGKHNKSVIYYTYCMSMYTYEGPQHCINGPVCKTFEPVCHYKIIRWGRRGGNWKGAFANNAFVYESSAVPKADWAPPLEVGTDGRSVSGKELQMHRHCAPLINQRIQKQGPDFCGKY